MMMMVMREMQTSILIKMKQLKIIIKMTTNMKIDNDCYKDDDDFLISYIQRTHPLGGLKWPLAALSRLPGCPWTNGLGRPTAPREARRGAKEHHPNSTNWSF